MIRTTRLIQYIILCILAASAVISCDRTTYNAGVDARLDFSSDTIMFDTVFTTIGSSTRQMKVYNPYDEHLKVSNVMLKGGGESPFSINLDGESGTYFEDVEIAPGDSLFLFAKVRIDPNDMNSPFVQEDEIVFVTNGNEQSVKLMAWGQNANYIVARDSVGSMKLNIIAGAGDVVRWTSERPYVIIGGYAAVDSLGSLIIDAGTHVYLHRGSGLWIYRYGNIMVNGTKGNEVIFESDRLEPEYDAVSGMWDRIWINEGPVRNEIHHAIIRNGFIGIQAESMSLSEYWQDNLLLDNVVIENMSGMGIYAVLYSINAANVLVDNCGSHLVALTMGGQYDFRNCTFANFWTSSIRQASSMYLSNYFVNEANVPMQVDLNSYYFGNCIVYGNQENEMILDGIGTFNCSLENCLVKTLQENVVDYEKYMSNCIVNKSPMFADSSEFDFHIDTIISPVINAGNIDIVNNSPINIQNDLDGVSRVTDEAPDLGVYEFKKDE